MEYDPLKLKSELEYDPPTVWWMKVSVSYLPDMFQAYLHLDKSKHVCISDADVLFCTRNPDSIMHQAGLRLLEGERVLSSAQQSVHTLDSQGRERGNGVAMAETENGSERARARVPPRRRGRKAGMSARSRLHKGATPAIADHS